MRDEVEALPTIAKSAKESKLIFFRTEEVSYEA